VTAKTSDYSGHLYIKNHTGPSWSGYLVDVPHPKGKEPPRKLFSTAHYGKLALRAAVEWRDAEYLRLWGKPISPNEKFVRQRVRKDNKTGILGVSRRWITTKTKRGGRVYRGRYEIVVAIHPNGATRKQFAVMKFGVREALRLARAARAQMVQDHLGYKA